MPDREIVIKILSHFPTSTFCAEGGEVTVADVLALLKAQEPVLDDTGVYHCMDCRHPVGYKNSAGVLFPHCFYCPRCGKAVKWDD